MQFGVSIEMHIRVTGINAGSACRDFDINEDGNQGGGKRRCGRVSRDGGGVAENFLEQKFRRKRLQKKFNQSFRLFKITKKMAQINLSYLLYSDVIHNEEIKRKFFD